MPAARQSARTISTSFPRAIAGVIGASEADLNRRNPFAPDVLASSRESIMIPHVDHRDWFGAVVRANRIMSLGVLWCALVICAISSVVYDVVHWLNAW